METFSLLSLGRRLKASFQATKHKIMLVINRKAKAENKIFYHAYITYSSLQEAKIGVSENVICISVQWLVCSETVFPHPVLHCESRLRDLIPYTVRFRN